MRINSHAHIFNLRSVFTTATQDTLIQRIARKNWPPFVMEAVSQIIKRVVTGEHLDEQALLSAFVGKIGVSDDFQKLIGGLNGKIPSDLQVVASGNLEGLAIDSLHDLVRRIGDRITGNHDAENESLSDLVDFLLTGIKSSIAEVTDMLMEVTPDDAVVVALSLDITDGGDEALWAKQLKDTSDAALAYPGRILPFVAINSRRATYFDHMDRALSLYGFVGVKMYPSLGYDVGLANLDRVYAYCLANDVPILLHCNHGGFCRTPDDVDFCNPARWRPVLEKYRDLRVCFGHFGGDENLTEYPVRPGSWTETILQLMDAFPNVYADISYHTDPMGGGDKQTNYFKNLTEILSHPTRRSRVLFGSDYFLVRQRVRDDNLWKYFENGFTAEQWDLITQANPRTYLGFPAGTDGAAARLNLKRHLAWLAKHATDVERIPAPWVTDLLPAVVSTPVNFQASELGPKWSVNNQAHIAVWRYLRRNEMDASQAALAFNAAGSIKLRALSYWNREHEGPQIFLDKRRLVSGDLHKTLLESGVNLESGVSPTVAVETMIGELASGDDALYDFAAVVDKVYRFPAEVAAL